MSVSDDNKQSALSAKNSGNEFYKRKQFKEAMEAYDKAIELDPNDMTYYCNRAAVYFELKDFDNCVKQCEKAIEVGRENRQDFKIIAKAYSRMANAYSKMEDLPNAKTYFQKSLAEHRTLKTLSKLSEIEKVLKDRERLAYLNPNKALEEKTLGNQCFTKDNYRRDSFNDRFTYDYLCEDILEFLPIEDKFRFECVSKQFQRTVYQKHYKLCLKSVDTKDLTNLETLLKKLPHIRSLSSEGLIGGIKDSELELIIKYCNHLTELKIDLGRVSATNRKLFFDKFGPQLTSISDVLESEDHSLMVSMVNIKELEFSNTLYPSIFKDIKKFITKTKPKNLKKLSLNISIDGNEFEEEINDFNALIENIKSVTHLKISFEGFDCYMEEDQIDVSFGVISQLDQLVSLEIDGDIKLISFKNDLKQLSANCPKLKSLILNCYIISDYSKDNDFMIELKKFKELKRFDIRCWEMPFKKHFLNSFKTGFKELTHLSLELIDYKVNETIVENIVNYLPNLKELIIKMKMNVTKRTADMISRLSKLETLHLFITNKSFCDSYKNQIIKNCRKIKSIKINYELV